MAAPLPDGEAERLAALHDYHILDTAPEAGFDDLVRLAAHVCGVPIAAVSLVDEHRQWFKSIIGLDITETSRDAAFCAHTILQPDLLIVPDTHADERFADNPLVTGDPGIRFYAGTPLVTESGHALGSLCVIDQVPRRLTPVQQDALCALGRLAGTQLALTRRIDAQERLTAERDRAEGARHRSEARLAEAQRVAKVGSWEYDFGTDSFTWSQEMFHLFEMDPTDGEPSLEALLGRYHPDDVPGYSATVHTAMQENRPHEFDLRILRRDGSARWVHAIGRDERDDAGRVIRLFGTLMDIHERKETEAALHKERQFQEALLENMQEGIVACDAGGTLRLFNRATREFHGMPAEPLPPGEWAEHFDLYRADGLTPMATADVPLFRALQGEIVRGVEMVIAPKRGAPRRTILASGQPILGVDGEKLGAVAAMHDVTEERQAQREAARLAAIVDSSHDAILGATLEGILVSWNAGAERLYGYTAAEVIGRHASFLGTPGMEGLVPDVISRLRGGQTIEPMDVTRTRKDGTPFQAVLSFSPIRDEAGGMIGLSCIARDTTARAAAETALRRSEARLVEAQRLAGIGDWEMDVVTGRFTWSAEVFHVMEFDPADGVPSFEAVMARYHPDDRPERDRLFAHSLATGEPYQCDLRLVLPSGTPRWCHLMGRPVRDGAGAVVRVTGTVLDITERRQAEEALRAGNAALQESQRFAHSIAENSASIIFVFDLDTRANVYANRDVAEFLGYAPEEIADLGADLLPAMIHPDDLPRLLAHFEEFDRVADGGVVEFEYRARHADGGWRWVWNREVVFRRHPDGRPWQILGNAQDVTERRSQEEAMRRSAEQLRRSEAGLRAVLESAPVILYAADADGTVTLSEGTGLAGLGLRPGEAVGRSVFEFSGGDATIEENTRRALAGESVSYDARVSGLCLHTEIRSLRDDAGTVTGIIGVCFDVSERARAEERFRVLFEQSSDAHLLCGAGGIVDCNDATLSLMRCTDRAQMLSIHPAVLSPEFQPDGRRSDEKGHAMEVLARERGSHRFEWMHRKMDGEEFPVEVTLTPVLLADGPVLLAVLHDLTDRKRAEEAVRDHAVILEFQKVQLETANRELEALATTDGLTGLTNHRVFQDRLAEEVRRAERYGTPLSIIFLDVDHFKSYNDRHGHPKGDDVLRRVAGLLRDSARETDLVARYGGEEFVLVLPHTSGGAALAVAERIRAAIEAAPWPLCPVTASFGVAALRQGVEGGTDLIARADLALYRAKKDGRNRVVVAPIAGRKNTASRKAAASREPVSLG